jgi:hypothetical protein
VDEMLVMTQHADWRLRRHKDGCILTRANCASLSLRENAKVTSAAIQHAAAPWILRSGCRHCTGLAMARD